MFNRSIARPLVLVFVLIWLAGLFSVRTNLLASDLGRHIMNGRVILESGSVFSTNYYSYTQSEFSAPNHHWLFGVLAHGLYELGGFSLLSIAGVTISVLSVCLLIWWIIKKERVAMMPTVLALWILMPIVTHRSEIRPEAISLLFITLSILILRNWLKAAHSNSFPRRLLWLIPLHAVWANVHIFFIFGGAVIAAAGFSLLLKKQWLRLRQLTVIGLGSLAASVLNPLGIEGVLYPFRIFDNYAYRIAENQSVWFFLHYQSGHWYYQYLAVVSVVIMLVAAHKLVVARSKLTSAEYFSTFLVLGFGTMTWSMTRYESLFAVSALLWFGATGWSTISELVAPALRRLSETIRLSLISLGAFGWLIFMLATFALIPIGSQYGFGLLPDNRESARFYRSLEVQGNLFNNYDVGGFLIFELFPSKKVFVDNRPEAYPGSFLTDVYIAAQNDDKVWGQIVTEYDIGSIFFYRHDLTEHGQNFMISRLKDERWVPIYVDDYALIFVDTRPEHTEIIEQYQLPDELFRYE